MRQRADDTFDAMAALEAGDIANRDENRMVGHYWLRAPDLAPTAEIRANVRDAVTSVGNFSRGVRDGSLRGASGRFKHLVHIGIGGSALGSEFVCDALDRVDDRLQVQFLDNADPDGLDRLLARLDGDLGRTLVSVVSKSGITPPTDFVRGELAGAFSGRGLDFASHAVATTMHGSPLDLRAREERWLAAFPIWDWVGGRMSVTSAVGLLPLALQGVAVASFLEGAAAMDRLTRARSADGNPAMLLALTWWSLGGGVGSKNMVVLPYRDRLALFARYVQQLVMESIGKRFDRDGELVEQGLTVYGHKGSSDQHSYLQQLRDGPADFFVTFIAVDREREADLNDVEPGVTLGDFLHAYLEGARDALSEHGRESITITLPDVSPRSVGALIALFERAVGFYAELVNVNAYHQPAVDKFAAAPTVALQRRVFDLVRTVDNALTAEEISMKIGCLDEAALVHRLLCRAARDPRRGIRVYNGARPCEARFGPSNGELVQQ